MVERTVTEEAVLQDDRKGFQIRNIYSCVFQKVWSWINDCKTGLEASPRCWGRPLT